MQYKLKFRFYDGKFFYSDSNKSAIELGCKLGGSIMGTFMSIFGVLDCEQYIGLKDMNGIEIWEGDIIEWRFNHGQEVPREQVMHSLKWDGKISPDTAPFMSAWGSTCGKYYRTFMNVYDPTRFAIVVGNIHENKDLLSNET